MATSNHQTIRRRLKIQYFSKYTAILHFEWETKADLISTSMYLIQYYIVLMIYQEETDACRNLVHRDTILVYEF